MKKWNFTKNDSEIVSLISEKTSLSKIAADVLISRGYDDIEKIKCFFSDNDFSDPFLIKDIDKAVERIELAASNGEKIAVYGDYDADGVTATYILYNYLSEIMGLDAVYYIPSREDEGYGLNFAAIDSLKDDGVTLIITVDNGITAIEETKYAAQKGIDMVITDHHKPLDVLPDAVAVVDPHRVDCESGLTYLCGAGVALKLVAALEGDIQMILDYYSQIAAIGTIADIVPIIGENKTIVSVGTRSINETENPGLIMLIKKAFGDKQVDSTDIAFGIVPRINAVGRLGCAENALLMLMCQDEETAEQYAEFIDGENKKRKEIEQKIFDEAMDYIALHNDIINQRIIIVPGKNWHNGVTGIVCARLMNQFQKPVILISSDGKEARGSGRSFGDFSLHKMLCSCEDLLTRFGGHIAAAGFTMPAENIDEFKRRALLFAAEKFDIMPIPELFIDAEIEPSEITVSAVESLDALKPFGTGNQSPVFLISDAKILAVEGIGADKHTKIKLEKNNTFFYVVYFGMVKSQLFLNEGDYADFAVHLSINEWQGKRNVSIIVDDVHPKKVDVDKFYESYLIFDKYKRGEAVTDDNNQLIVPARDEIAVVYRLVKNKGTLSITYENLAVLCGQNYGKTRIIIEVLTDLGLIKTETELQKVRLSIIDTDKKVDLNSSSVLSGLCKR